MKLAITESRKIGELQDEFNHLYPFLRLEFLRNHTSSDQPIRVLNSGSTLGDNIYFVHEGSIQLSDNMTVSELADVFKDRFGIDVRVLRRCGNVWLETTMTPHWTLQHQNRYGYEIAAQIY